MSKQRPIAKVTLARSVNEIELIGFKFDKDKEELACSVCTFSNSESKQFSNKGIFKYETSIGLAFPAEVNLPDKFRFLKRNVKRHIEQSCAHTENLQAEIEKRKQVERKISKNYEAGMNLGRLCYKLFYERSPFYRFQG